MKKKTLPTRKIEKIIYMIKATLKLVSIPLLAKKKARKKFSAFLKEPLKIEKSLTKSPSSILSNQSSRTSNKSSGTNPLLFLSRWKRAKIFTNFQQSSVIHLTTLTHHQSTSLPEEATTRDLTLLRSKSLTKKTRLISRLLKNP